MLGSWKHRGFAMTSRDTPARAHRACMRSRACRGTECQARAHPTPPLQRHRRARGAVDGFPALPREQAHPHPGPRVRHPGAVHLAARALGDGRRPPAAHPDWPAPPLHHRLAVGVQGAVQFLTGGEWTRGCRARRLLGEQPLVLAEADSMAGTGDTSSQGSREASSLRQRPVALGCCGCSSTRTSPRCPGTRSAVHPSDSEVTARPVPCPLLTWPLTNPPSCPGQVAGSRPGRLPAPTTLDRLGTTWLLPVFLLQALHGPMFICHSMLKTGYSWWAIYLLMLAWSGTIIVYDYYIFVLT
ncbi:hypothetical protein ACKKBG_A03775 [Auxenochlorella protothecoides x Auxenochlorella symbiontica]